MKPLLKQLALHTASIPSQVCANAVSISLELCRFQPRYQVAKVSSTLKAQ